MLGTLRKFFVKKDNLNAESKDYELKPSSNPSFLTDSKQINQLLIDIESASPLCSITFEGVNEEFSSSILDIQIKNQQIILDELIPKHGNKLLINKNSFKLSTAHNGIHLAFKLSNVSTGTSRGLAYYKAHFPDRIYYPQRRNSPRIQINSLNIPFSGISSHNKSIVGGYIFDLSRNGMSIIMPNNRTRIKRGNTLKDCKITINEQTIMFNLIVRFVKTMSPGSRKTLIGGYYENISSQKMTKLAQFIASIEREEIRKRKN